MSHVNESCHIWMSHVTCNESRHFKRTSESCPMWMSHVPCEWVMSPCYKRLHLDDSMSHVNESRHTHEWVTSHVRMSHVVFEWVMLHLNESCPPATRARLMMSHYTWMSHVAYTNESHHTYEWAMLHLNESCRIWMSHVVFEWVMSPCYTCSLDDVTSHMNESCRTYQWVTSHIRMSHVAFEWVMSHCYVWHDS